MTVKTAFNIVAAACETLKAVTRLIDLMPGNEEHQIDKDFQVA